MFLEDPRRFFRFAETTRYNARCTGGEVRQSPLQTGASLRDHYHHQRHSLFNDEDMTNSTGAPDPSAGSTELLRPWRRIAQHLCPLIGESGFCALFGRAVHVIGPDHAWLAPQQPCRAPAQLFTSLEERMALVDAERAAAANEALLQTFTQLLAALIGERLTQRLLESASATRDAAPGQQKNAQEQK
jgi:hypothetical protein